MPGRNTRVPNLSNHSSSTRYALSIYVNVILGFVFRVAVAIGIASRCQHVIYFIVVR